MTLGCEGRFGRHSIQVQMNDWVVLLLHSVTPLRVLLSSHNTFYFGFMVSNFEASHGYKENVNCPLKQDKCLTLCTRGTQWCSVIHSAGLPSSVLWWTSGYLVYWVGKNSVSALAVVRMSIEALNKGIPVILLLSCVYQITFKFHRTAKVHLVSYSIMKEHNKTFTWPYWSKHWAYTEATSTNRLKNCRILLGFLFYNY